VGIIIDWHLPFDPAAQGIIIDYTIGVDPDTGGIIIEWSPNPDVNPGPPTDLEQQPGPPTDPVNTGAAQGIIIIGGTPGGVDPDAQGLVVNWFPNDMGGGANGMIIHDTAGSEETSTPRISIQLQRLSNP
jgi:hypothetical protein